MAQFTLDGVTYSRFRDIPGAVYTRSGVEYQQNAAGVWTPFDENVPPRSDGVGVDVWEARTNYIGNPTFQGTGGAKAGTNSGGIIGSVPDRMQIRNDAPGVTVTIVGTGVEFGLPYMDVDLAGTALATTWLRIFWENNNQPCADGQTWTQALYGRLLSGSVAGIGSVLAYGDIFAGAGYAATLNFGSILSKIVASPTPVRMGGQATIAAAGATGIQAYIAVASASAAAVSARIRFYAPNLKLGANINDPPILQTTNAAATRGNPSMYINAPGLLVPPYTIQAWANLSATGGILVVASDGTTANRVQLERSSGNGATMQVNGGTGGSGPTVPGKGGARLLKMAGRVRATEYALSVDGAAPLISSGVTPPSGLSQIRFGANPGGVGILNGAIQRFQIINRDVSDAELVALTA